MNIKRLRTFARFLERHKPLRANKHEHFHMRLWFSHQDANGPYGIRVVKNDHGFDEDTTAVPDGALLECGMAACAFGWACTIPAFQKEGLGVVHYGLPMGFAPQFAGKTGFDAATAFFGIPPHVAKYLFESGKYPISPGEITPTMVAKRVRDVIAGNIPAE